MVSHGRSGLVASLRQYNERNICSSRKTPEELEDEIQQRTYALQMADPNRRGTAFGNPEAVPRIFTPKAKEGSIRALLEARAKEHALEDQRDGLLDVAQLEEVWDMLSAFSRDSEFHDQRINYDDFTKIRRACEEQFGQQKCACLFRASTFLRFPQNREGSISIEAFYHYLTGRNHQERTAVDFLKHDSDNDGLLTAEELEHWVEDQISSGAVLHLNHIDRFFITQYKHIAAQKFVFFHGKRGKVRIRDILTSPVLSEWFMMAKPKSSSGPSTSNWFSLESANRVYKMFMDLDQRMTGSLSPNELAKYSTTMTKLVVSRVFEEHAGRCRSRGGPTNKGEMVFTEFLDFVLAWENKDSSPSIAYFFTVYDLKKAGYLTGVEIYIFLMEIYKMWVNLGYYTELSVGDVKDEIFDMVKPKEELKITLKELIDCKVGGTIMTMMADVRAFWEYDNRESLMQQNEDESS